MVHSQFSHRKKSSQIALKPPSEALQPRPFAPDKPDRPDSEPLARPPKLALTHSPGHPALGQTAPPSVQCLHAPTSPSVLPQSIPAPPSMGADRGAVHGDFPRQPLIQRVDLSESEQEPQAQPYQPLQWASADGNGEDNKTNNATSVTLPLRAFGQVPHGPELSLQPQSSPLLPWSGTPNRLPPAPLIQRWPWSSKQKTAAQFWAEVQTDIDKKTAELRKQLEKDFGVDGMSSFGFSRRSEEARAWRKQIKDSARVQARADVDTTLDTYDPTASGNRSLLETEKAYYRIDAKKRVYKDAKTSVKTVVLATVNKIFDTIWSNAGVLQQAQILYQQELDRDGGTEEAARLLATRKVQDLYAKAKVDATTAKRVAFQKQNQGNQISPEAQTAATLADTRGQGGLTDQAKAQVTQDQVGLRAVKKTIEADSVEQGMGVLGTLLDNVVGSAGDQVSLSIQFKVPVAADPSGVAKAYAQFTLTGKAARGIDGAMTSGIPVFGDPRRLEVMAEFAFRLGVDVAEVLDLGVDFSMFVRGGANDTALCMKTLSYGAYRRLGAVSETAANWWAGAGQGVDEGKTLRAEAWAAMVEEQAFKTQASGKKGGGFVDVGGGIGASGGLKVEGLFEAGLGGSVSGFHRYDEAALKDSLGSAFGTVVTDKSAAKDRRRRVKGSAGASYSISGKAKFAIPGFAEVEIAGSISGSIESPLSFGIEITGTLGYAGGSTNMIEQWAAGYATAVADLLKGFPKAVKPLFTDRQDAGVFGEAIAATTQGINASLENTVTDSIAKAWSVGSGADAVAGLATSSSLQVALLIGCDGEKPIFRLEIRSGRKLEISTPMIGATGVKITAEKTSRLFAIGFDSGKVDAEILGVRARGKTNQRGVKHRV